jgi:hypothetical protein
VLENVKINGDYVSFLRLEQKGRLKQWASILGFRIKQQMHMPLY